MPRAAPPRQLQHPPVFEKLGAASTTGHLGSSSICDRQRNGSAGGWRAQRLQPARQGRGGASGRRRQWQ